MGKISFGFFAWETKECDSKFHSHCVAMIFTQNLRMIKYDFKFFNYEGRRKGSLMFHLKYNTALGEPLSKILI